MHVRSDAFPGGESLDDAARRYADAFELVLDRPESPILVVTHEIPLRYAINAADGSDDLDGPAHQLANATPYVFDEVALRRAVEGIRRLT
jgi:broad specificity phosphatase PhoE